MSDKKISELNSAGNVAGTDISLLVRGEVDYNFTMAELLEFIQENITGTAHVYFGTAAPVDSSGNEGDVFFYKNGEIYVRIYQKVSDSWLAMVTIPLTGPDGCLLFGEGEPEAETGKISDAYIDTLTGIFYKYEADGWAQQFSMATGPAGAKGDKGDKGDPGEDGRTILYGTTAPSNLTDGVDGDFYINTSVWYLFGPKASGAWPAGISIVQSPDDIKTVKSGLTDPLTIDWQTDEDGAAKHGNFPTYQEINKADNGKWTINATPNVEETRNDAGDQLLSVILTPSVPGQTNFIII